MTSFHFPAPTGKGYGLTGDKDDLTRVVVEAMEENWLNQAPHPTLDKEEALKKQESRSSGGGDEHSELSESEKNTHELERIRRQQKDLDDEACAGLWSRSSNGGSCEYEGVDEDLPFLESTLPQERTGTVTITPSSKRMSAEVKLASTSRPPRPSVPKNAASLIREYSQAGSSSSSSPAAAAASAEKIKVRLPKQDSKSRIRPMPETWESFSSKVHS